MTDRGQALGVLLDAQSGDLRLEAFYERWPASADPLLEAIFEETEDTVEHVPGSWRRREVDYERFRESYAYQTLLVDRQLLHEDFADVPSLRLVELRKQLLREINLDEDDEAVAMASYQFVAKAIATP